MAADICRDCGDSLTGANRVIRKRRCKSCYNARHRETYYANLGRGPLPYGGVSALNPLRDEIMRLFDGEARLGQAQIAIRLGISRNAVAGIVHRNRARPVASHVFDPFPKSANSCRYISGHPKEGAVCCGEPVLHLGEAWCATHRAIVYRPRPKDAE